MKNIFSPFTKLVAVASCALALGSCSRSEYAMLPKGGSYHGVARASAPVPTTPAAGSTEAPATEAGSAVAVAPEATTAPTAVAVAPTAKLAATAKQVVIPAEISTSATAAAVAAPTHKLNVIQRLALNNVTRKVDKLMQKATARQHDNTASTARGSISGNLRIGLILLLVGLLVGLLNGLIGTIIAIVGLIFIVLWLLDQL
ncbi:MAG: hypothetical protein NVSMB30_07990 [Hymenobacter sp.]